MFRHEGQVRIATILFSASDTAWPKNSAYLWKSEHLEGFSFSLALCIRPKTSSSLSIVHQSCVRKQSLYRNKLGTTGMTIPTTLSPSTVETH